MWAEYRSRRRGCLRCLTYTQEHAASRESARCMLSTLVNTNFLHIIRQQKLKVIISNHGINEIKNFGTKLIRLNDKKRRNLLLIMLIWYN